MHLRYTHLRRRYSSAQKCDCQGEGHADQTGTSTGACRLVPLSNEMFGIAGPTASAVLNEIAKLAANLGNYPRELTCRMHTCPQPCAVEFSCTCQRVSSEPLRPLGWHLVSAGLPVPIHPHQAQSAPAGEVWARLAPAGAAAAYRSWSSGRRT